MNLQSVCDPRDPAEQESEKLQHSCLITEILPEAINIPSINNNEN